MATVRLGRTWLKTMLATFSPACPVPGAASPMPANVRPGTAEMRALRHFYGTGNRYRSVLEIYALMKAKVRLWWAGTSFGSTWSQLVCSEWLAHSRLEDHIKGKLYRDHIIHPAAAAMLGWEILARFRGVVRQRAGHALRRKWGSQYGIGALQDWQNILERAWLVASLFHDHGCPQELIAKCDFRVRRAQHRRFPFSLEDHKKETEELEGQGCIDGSTRDTIIEKLGLDRRTEPKHTHAVVSALGIYGLKKRATTEFERAILDLAADAVLWHHSTGRDYDLSRSKDLQFNEHPLRYLLVLCDGLHEFCRELLVREEDKNVKGRHTTELRESCTAAELTACKNQLSMTYFVNCDERICDTRWQLKHFTEGLKKLERFMGRCDDGLIVKCAGREHVNHGNCRRCRKRRGP